MMRKIYWRPKGIPVTALILLCAIAIFGMLAVEFFQRTIRQPYYGEKIEAARLALRAMEHLRESRLKMGMKINEDYDPARSGLIGSRMTEVTTDRGDLEAKQTSVNPNFAAVLVHLLKELNVKKGDPVAVSFTGSFPALNVSVLAAVQTMGLKPVIVTSVGASQWGANQPGFLWIDMERLLQEAKIFTFRSTAASLGGKGDQGKEISEFGRRLLAAAIARNRLIPITAVSIGENVDQRINIYYRDAAPKVFINVGGGVVSVGKRAYRKKLKPGIISSGNPASAESDSVIYSFLEKNVPVIHLENIADLALAYGLPESPPKMPPVGQGKIFSRREYDRWLSGLVLLTIFLVLYTFTRTDLGFRIFQSSGKDKEAGPPEPMI